MVSRGKLLWSQFVRWFDGECLIAVEEKQPGLRDILVVCQNMRSGYDAQWPSKVDNFHISDVRICGFFVWYICFDQKPKLADLKMMISERS